MYGVSNRVKHFSNISRHFFFFTFVFVLLHNEPLQARQTHVNTTGNTDCNSLNTSTLVLDVLFIYLQPGYSSFK